MILLEILAIIRRWLWFILLGALVGIVLSYGSIMRNKPVYETTAGIVVVRSGIEVNLDPRIVSTSAEGGMFDLKGEGLSTLASLVSNEAIAQQAYADLNGELAQLVRQPADLTRMVSGDIENGVIQIKARSSDPQLARKLANVWAIRYTDYVNRIYAGKLVASEFTQQIGVAKGRYEDAEAALVEFMRNDKSQELESAIEEKQALLDHLIILRSDEIGGRLQTVSERRKQTQMLLQNAIILQKLLETSSSLPTNAANSLALLYLQYGFVNGGGGTVEQAVQTEGQTIVIARDQTGEFQFNFTPQRLEDVASTPQQLRSDLSRLIDTLQVQLADYEAEIADLMKAVAAETPTATDRLIQNLFKDITNLEGEVEALDAQKKELTQERDLLWESYTLLTKGSEEATLTAAATSDTLVRFAIPAPLPKRPIKSSSPQTIVLGAFAGLMIAAAGVFVYELLDDKVRSRADIEQVLDIPVLGQVPRSVAERNHQPISLVDSASPFTEAMRMLRVLITRLDDAQRCILVTSWKQGEGKSAIAANLAVVSARSGRSVLLIDGNLRSPRLHELFGLSKDVMGLNHLLQEKAMSLAEVVQATTISNLSLLPVGNSADLHPDLLASERVEQMLVEAAKVFDTIIIDSPAVSFTADALALTEKADWTLLVVKANATKVMEVQNLQQSLEGAGGKVLGVVLNRVKGADGFFGRG